MTRFTSWATEALIDARRKNAKAVAFLEAATLANLRLDEGDEASDRIITRDAESLRKGRALQREIEQELKERGVE